MILRTLATRSVDKANLKNNDTVSVCVQSRMHAFLLACLELLCVGCATRPVGRYELVTTVRWARKELPLAEALQARVGDDVPVTITMTFDAFDGCTGSGSLDVYIREPSVLSGQLTRFNLIRYSRREVHVSSNGLLTAPIVLQRGSADMLRIGELVFRRQAGPRL